MQLNFLTSAFEDIEAIREYMAQSSPAAAQRFVDAVFTRVEQLENFPQMGRAVPELRNETIRELLYRQYRIIYKLRANGRIDIVSVQTGLRPLRLSL